MSFFDHRDLGKRFILSHIYLLIGIALPVWLYGFLHLGVDRRNAALRAHREKTALRIASLGIVTVAVGDAVVSVVSVTSRYTASIMHCAVGRNRRLKLWGD